MEEYSGGKRIGFVYLKEAKLYLILDEQDLNEDLSTILDENSDIGWSIDKDCNTVLLLDCLYTIGEYGLGSYLIEYPNEIVVINMKYHITQFKQITKQITKTNKKKFLL